MSRKTNEKFLEAYLELDRYCCEKFGVPTGGVTEYINRLGNARFAPNRDDALPRLVKYRNIRNIFAHEPMALKKSNEVSSSDVSWLKKFTKDLYRKKDPISSYLKKARRYATGKRIRRYIILAALVMAFVIGAIVYVQLSK